MTLQRIQVMQSAIMKRIAAAATVKDVARVRHWSAVAQDCDSLERSANELELEVIRIQGILDGRVEDLATPEVARQVSPVARRAASARRDGAETRAEWAKRVIASGIQLRGSGKQYTTRSGQAVGVAFANELPGSPNRWWLGLSEQSSGVAALLCRDKGGKLIDIIIPIAELGFRWNSLSRNNGQIKFNVRRDGSDLVLLIPGSVPVSVKRYVGHYSTLK